MCLYDELFFYTFYLVIIFNCVRNKEKKLLFCFFNALHTHSLARIALYRTQFCALFFILFFKTIIDFNSN